MTSYYDVDIDHFGNIYLGAAIVAKGLPLDMHLQHHLTAINVEKPTHPRSLTHGAITETR